MEHDNVEQVIYENHRRGRPRIRWDSLEEREFQDRQLILTNERFRRSRDCRSYNVKNNSNTSEPHNNQKNSTERSRQCRRRYRNRENDDEEREFRNLRRARNAENRRFLEQNSNVNEHSLGEMDVSCSHCNAEHLTAEKVFKKGNSFNECSFDGTVKLEAIPDFPDNLCSLFEYNPKQSKAFFERIQRT